MTARRASVHLILSRDPRRLLEAAAAGFFAPRSPSAGPWPSPPYILALRQGGLRDDLIGLAAERGVAGWFDPPLRVFHELPGILGAGPLKPCGEFERTVILGGALRRFGGEVFGRLHRGEDFIAALDRLFGELLAEGVTPDGFRAALRARGDRDEFERDRDAELDLVFQSYVEQLAAAGRRDGRDTWLDSARALTADPAAFARRLGERREIRLLGLQDLRGGWRALLAALAASPALDRMAIYTADELDLGPELPAQVTRLDAADALAARTFAPAPPPAPAAARPRAGESPALAFLAAPDVERELDEVARRVRQLADAGAPLGRIAVVTRQARPYVDLAVAALDRFGVPATARRRTALREIPAVRAVRSLLAAAADGWSRHGLVELAEQPYLANELDARMLNFAGFSRRISGLAEWERTLRQLGDAAAAEEARGSGDDGDHRRAYPPSPRLRAAAEAFARFAAQAAALDRKRTLAEWLEWLDRFLSEDPWGIERRIHAVPGERFDVVRLDLAGRRMLGELVTAWRQALGAWGGADDPLAIEDFHRQLDDLLDGDVALPTPVPHGVQVLEALAAAYRSFDHVFVVGLEGGRFPVRQPGSPILDEAERAALAEHGLPFEPRAVWDARERELFRMVVAGATGTLTLSWARVDAAGREVGRSAFVEALAEAAGLDPEHCAEETSASEVTVPGARLYAGADGPARALHAWRIERARRSGEPSPWNGRIESPALLAWLAEEFGDGRLWSPTQLESYAKCPWSYFSRRLLRVARLEDPDEDMDAATRGTLAHEALHRFYDAALAKVGGPVLLREHDREWASPLLDHAVEDAFAGAQGRWLGHPTLLHAKRAELRRLLHRYLDFELAQNEKMFNNRSPAARMLRTGVAEHELTFDDVVLERGGVRFRFRGSIDRVETGVDERVASGGFVAAVDYKSSKDSAPGGGSSAREAPWHDRVVLQVPLYAYALATLRPDLEVARVEYRALKQRETVHPLDLVKVDRAAGALTRDAAARAKLDTALDAVAEHVLRIRAGEFPAAPVESCGCPSFCHALEICRVKGGPRVDNH